jgi:cellulose synthase (UDP-forming)
MRLTAMFDGYPWLIAMVAIAFCFLIAKLMQARLRRRARERLQGTD